MPGIVRDDSWPCHREHILTSVFEASGEGRNGHGQTSMPVLAYNMSQRYRKRLTTVILFPFVPLMVLTSRHMQIQLRRTILVHGMSSKRSTGNNTDCRLATSYEPFATMAILLSWKCRLFTKIQQATCASASEPNKSSYAHTKNATKNSVVDRNCTVITEVFTRRLGRSSVKSTVATDRFTAFQGWTRRPTMSGRNTRCTCRISRAIPRVEI